MTIVETRAGVRVSKTMNMHEPVAARLYTPQDLSDFIQFVRLIPSCLTKIHLSDKSRFVRQKTFVRPAGMRACFGRTYTQVQSTTLAGYRTIHSLP